MVHSVRKLTHNPKKAAGPPYPPRNAAIGGLPDTTHDVPASAVLVAIFACLAATHMTILQINKRRGILFIPSGVTFGFCMARVTTFVMRIVWAKNPTNASVAIAASIFVGAGVLLLMIVNMLYAQRVMRGYHPRFGHWKWTNRVFGAWYGSIGATLVMFIITGVYSMYTLEPGPLMKMRGKFTLIYPEL